MTQQSGDEAPRLPPRRARQEGGRRKMRFPLWLSPETYSALKATAQQRQIPATILAEQSIRTALSAAAEDRLDGPALPAVRQVVEEAMTQHTERLAALLVKGFIEAGLSRRLSWSLVYRTYGSEKAGELLESARTRVMEDLRKKIDDGPATRGGAA